MTYALARSTVVVTAATSRGRWDRTVGIRRRGLIHDRQVAVSWMAASYRTRGHQFHCAAPETQEKTS